MRRQQVQVSKMHCHHVKEVIALRGENAHLQEYNRSRKPEVNPPDEGREAKSTTFCLPKATNLSV